MNATFEFPDIIHINIIDARTRWPVQNIALLMHLLALKNMDYFLLTPLSDDQGDIKISKGWLTKKIDSEAGHFPVDHVSSIDDLYPELEVVTATEDDINKSIDLLSNNQSYGENIVQIQELSNSVNHLYSDAKISVELNNEHEIWITLEIIKYPIDPMTVLDGNPC